MLSTQIAPDSIATAIQLLKQSKFTQAQQLQIESTIERSPNTIIGLVITLPIGSINKLTARSFWPQPLLAGANPPTITGESHAS
ncbi:MAG: hypothetical protein HC895_25940 [Leptolyngbyaceae cyanobacterium SM1_3_5]|nr:hypothetical protein [Leptolyngbyaceae cyanobacterium SM1_3_5]